MSKIKSYLEDEMEFLEQILGTEFSKDDLVNVICSHPNWMRLSTDDKVKYLLSI